MNIAKSTLLLALCTAPATSQSLEIEASIDPYVDIVMYELLVSGPPLGQAYVFASLRQGDPMWFPGIHGELLIDPGFAMPLGAVPLDASGQGYLALFAPLPIGNGLPLFGQSVTMDGAAQLFFSNFSCGLAQLVHLPIAFGMGVASHYAVGLYRLRVTDGPAGGLAELLVNGGQKAIILTTLDGDGDGEVVGPVPGGMQRGDTVAIRINGVVVKQWVH